MAVIGSPRGLESTAFESILAAQRRERANLYADLGTYIAGSSDSPVLSMGGFVIGMATAVVKNGQALNLAVPAEAIQAAINLEREATAMSENDPNAFADVPSAKSLWSDPRATAAQATRKSKNNAESLKLLNALVSDYPNEPILLIGRALVFTSLEFNAEAAADAAAALEMSPRSYRAAVLPTQSSLHEHQIPKGRGSQIRGQNRCHQIRLMVSIQAGPMPPQRITTRSRSLRAGRGFEAQ